MAFYGSVSGVDRGPLSSDPRAHQTVAVGPDRIERTAPAPHRATRVVVSPRRLRTRPRRRGTRSVNSVNPQGENNGTGHSTNGSRRTTPKLGLVPGSRNRADRAWHRRHGLGVRDDHRVGVFLWVDSHRRWGYGSRACLLAQTLGRLFSRLADGHFVRRRGLDDGYQSSGVGDLADVAHRYVLGFPGGVSDRGGARRALSALGLGTVGRYCLSSAGHSHLAAMASVSSVG